MREIVDLMKELLLIKPETQGDIGLCGLKRSYIQDAKRSKKKIKKEVSLSELMHRR